MKQIMIILSIEPEMAEVYKEIAEDMALGKLEPVILSEIAAFAHYRLEYRGKRNDPNPISLI
ncbi:hypothetical protein JR338_06165 [Chloroflexota bacterium]|nr:hypothetical protein JR338_06165 [Chloroflexota bacterium]